MSSWRWSRRISRCRVKLLAFRAEVARVDSESRRRVSCVIRASRWERDKSINIHIIASMSFDQVRYLL